MTVLSTGAEYTLRANDSHDARAKFFATGAAPHDTAIDARLAPRADELEFP